MNPFETPGAISWNELVSTDPAGAATFYSALFGWKVNANNALGYRTVETGNGRGINGGVWPSPPEGHNLVQLFVEVDDIDAALTRIERTGGAVQLRPHAQGALWLATFQDPAGNLLGLWQAGPRAAVDGEA